ncbi:type II toxin-antitoxin system VapC family toxin [Mucilaginibacter sp. McL0603]|uniref:type II toxin-antitoxin system VapC family toxin n=1 Tax=Mucilaginibacter sp. McL0603 TaxID=3415670 RepID=UPI003CF51257
MNLLLDTNIILHIIRAKDFTGIINFINPDNSPIYLSIVSEAEIKSLALRKKWGTNRLHLLDVFLDQVNIVEINQASVNIYAEIDAYSQRSNKSFDKYPFDTPRNMGKNDLWIASLSALLGLRFITTDADFDHLHNIFFEIKKIKSTEFLPFF